MDYNYVKDISLNKAWYYDKVYACWLGKNIGDCAFFIDGLGQLVHAFRHLLCGTDVEGNMHHKLAEQLTGADSQSAAVVKTHLCAPLAYGAEQALQLATLI